MATIHIVDDEQSVRDSLASLVGQLGHQTKCYADAESFLSVGQYERPGCLLLDQVLTGMSGIDLLEQLRKQQSSLPVILLSAHLDVPLAVRAMGCGALTLIEKPGDFNSLSGIITDALAWDRQQLVVERRVKEFAKREQTLTDRERLVLDKILSGNPNKAIARSLDVSERTIESDRAKILKRFEAGNVVELASKITECRVLADRQFWLDTPCCRRGASQHGVSSLSA